MLHLQNIKFNYKLGAIALIPLLGLVFVSINSMIKEFSRYQTAAQVQEVAAFSVTVSALLHEYQKERGLSSGFIGSEGRKFKEELQTQRKQTDAKITVLEQVLSTTDFANEAKLNQALSSARTSIKQLPTIRNSVDALTISLKDATGYYTGVNRNFTDIAATLPGMTQNVDISRKLTAYANFIKSKELAGIERALLTNTFSKNNFETGVLEKVIAAVSKQETFLEIFADFATEEYKNVLNKALQGEFMSATSQMRSIALSNGYQGNFGIDPSVWFKNQTQKIDALKSVEDQMANHNIEEAITLKKSSLSQIMLDSALILLIIMLSSILFWVIRRDIAKEIGGEPLAVLQMAQRVANGYLYQDTPASKFPPEGIVKAMTEMQQRLTEVLQTVNQCAFQIASDSKEISNTSNALSQTACEQAASVEQTSASMEQLNASVEQNREHAQLTEEIAVNVAKLAVEGGEAVTETINAMEQIAQRVGIIEEIAYQTNILALNASIEAARVGVHGAGFAVVANEVRRLAERSQSAASEITELSQSSLNVSKHAGALLNQIVPNIKKTAALIQEISSASSEQAAGIRQINDAIHQLDSVTQINAASAEQLAATAEELDSQSQTLVDEIGFFKLPEQDVDHRLQ